MWLFRFKRIGLFCRGSLGKPVLFLFLLVSEPSILCARLSGRIFIIAVLRLTRCVAVLKRKLAVTTSCPVVNGCTSLSAHSARVSSSLPRMPLTKKFGNTLACDSLGAVQAGASTEDEDPASQKEGLAAGEDNIGDSEIIKSPSDPKHYR